MRKLFAAVVLLVIFGADPTFGADLECVKAQSRGEEIWTPADLDELRTASGTADLASPRDGTCFSMALFGEIRTGDLQKLERALRLHSPWVSSIFLWSSGGDVREAMAIGRLLRRELVRVYAPIVAPSLDLLDFEDLWHHGNLLAIPRAVPGGGYSVFCTGKECVCASACALIWLSAAERHGTAIILHRPYFDRAATRVTSAIEYDRAYQELLSEIRSFATEVQMPPVLLEKMIRIPSESSQRLTPAEIRDLGEHPPAIHEWMNGRCGAIPSGRSGEALTRKAEGLATSEDLKFLEATFQSGRCRAFLFLIDRIQRAAGRR